MSSNHFLGPSVEHFTFGQGGKTGFQKLFVFPAAIPLTRAHLWLATPHYHCLRLPATEICSCHISSSSSPHSLMMVGHHRESTILSELHHSSQTFICDTGWYNGLLRIGRAGLVAACGSKKPSTEQSTDLEAFVDVSDSPPLTAAVPALHQLSSRRNFPGRWSWRKRCGGLVGEGIKLGELG